jgi:hypothetical protein
VRPSSRKSGDVVTVIPGLAIVIALIGSIVNLPYHIL